MDQKSDLIKEDIDETRTALTEKLVTLEDQLRDKVEGARETVEETIENVKTSLRKFSPRHQVQQHPFVMVGAASAAGLLVGQVVQVRRAQAAEWTATGAPAQGARYAPERPVPQTSAYEDASDVGSFAPPDQGRWRAERAAYAPAPHRPRRPSVLAKLADTFSDELDMIKAMALAAALDTVRRVAKDSMPKLGEQIDRVMDSAMTKVGADPEPEPAKVSRL
jgi:ElaB/YqjD/DUF883 family membrane-anchored ribosome-binding protein